MPDLQVREKWRVAPAMCPPNNINGNNKSSISSNHKASLRPTGRGSVASSPVTSSSEGYTADMWRDSLPRHQSNGSRSGESVLPLGNSTCLSSTPQFLPRRLPATIQYSVTPNQRRVAPIQEEVAKTVEVKVQRSERTERTEKMENKEWANRNAMYTEPTIRGQPSYGSRSSLATSHLRGEPSEIDFSWVHEEENRLKDERDRTKSLPECYFGMDPPLVEDNQGQSQTEARELEEKENKERERLWNIRNKTVLLEHETMKKRKEHALRVRSSTHFEEPQPDYFPMVERSEMSGPAERRLQKMQREENLQKGRMYEVNHRDRDRQRWRSSIAF